MIQPYNPLCYPLHMETQFKKERTKNIIIFSIAIVFIILASCAAVLLTNAFAPNFLQIAISLTGIALPYTLSFLCIGSYNKIIILNKKIEKERLIIDATGVNLANNDVEAKKILAARIADLPDPITLEAAKSLPADQVAKRLRSNQKRKFLISLITDEKSSQYYTFFFKKYNADQWIEMVRDRIPFCTSDSGDLLFWKDCFL